jgi:ATP-dependent Clp protease ATP-binding subunit ClpC
MFERYTEKARRVIFFARFEASQFGSPTIGCEHLLLGVLRETKSLRRWLGKESPESIRKRIDEHTPRRPSIPTSVDLPLDGAAKRVLKQAADEADRLAHRHIGTEHLFLALLNENSFALEILRDILRNTGVDVESVRLYIATNPEPAHVSPIPPGSLYGRRLHHSAETVEIHGSRRNVDYVRDAVGRCRGDNWHWHKAAWTPRDIAVEKRLAVYRLISLSPATPGTLNW